MDGLQIRHLEALEVALGDRNGGVAKDLGEVKEIPPVSEVRHSEGMAQRVRAEPDSRHAEFPPNHLQVPLEIPHGDEGILAGAKQQPSRSRVLCRIAVEGLPHRHSEGH